MEPAILQLVLAAVLLLVHVVAIIVATRASVEREWAVGPRDEPTNEGRMLGRFRRILANYLETLPAFALVLVAAELSGRGNDWTLVGGWVWLAGRVVYLPVYAAGIPWVRTIVWIVATLGIVVMLVGLALGPG